VDFDPGVDDTARLLVPLSELGDPLDDDDGVDTDDGAMIGSGTLDKPESSALPLVDVSGVVGPLATADGTTGEPGSSARYTKINTIPKTPATPITFCKCRILTTYLNSFGGLRFTRSRLDISSGLVPILPRSVARRSEDLLGLGIHNPLTRVSNSNSRLGPTGLSSSWRSRRSLSYGRLSLSKIGRRTTALLVLVVVPMTRGHQSSSQRWKILISARAAPSMLRGAVSRDRSTAWASESSSVRRYSSELLIALHFRNFGAA
jgi:hypothetical protein